MKELLRLYRDATVVMDPPASSGTPPVATPPAGTPPSDASSSGTPPVVTPPAVTPPSFVIPDAYKDKSYLKGVDSPEKLFKMLDGAQELIGKKGPSKPVDGAPQAEWDAYYESQGRPKTAAEYVFEPVEGMKYDEKLTAGVKELMFKNGVSATQAKGLQKGFDTIVAQIAQEKGIQLKQLDQDFDKLGTQTFGAERDRVLANSKALIEKHSSVNMKPYIENLPNESLVVLADVLNNVSKIYIKQDGAPGGGPTVTGQTPAEISSKGRELMASEAYNNPWHKDHVTVVKQVKDLYAPIKR